MPWSRSILGFLVLPAVAVAGDWPQWLGPNRDAASTERVAAWTETPKVLWRQPVGEGNSSPVVSDGRVFIHAKIKDKDQEELIAFDARTGKPLWRKVYARAPMSFLYGNGPRATPAVVGDRVFTFGITGVLSCFEAPTGKILWQIDTLQKFQAPRLLFGASCSPIVEGNRVLMNVGAKGASVVAFDKNNGDVLWKNLDDRASYSSPIAFGEGNNRQVVFLTGQNLISLNPRDGHVKWKFPLVDSLLESSCTPLRVGDMLLASSITYGSVGLRLVTREDNVTAEQVWKNDTLTCYFSTPVSVGNDYVYLITGTKPPAIKSEATLHCIEAKTGKDLWQKAKIGQYHASLLRTGNDKLLLLDDAGQLALVDPNPKQYRELARTPVCRPTWAHPALADGRLYVRDEKELICFQLGE
jgi:outer membrane protein assembly factor BamB